MYGVNTNCCETQTNTKCCTNVMVYITNVMVYVTNVMVYVTNVMVYVSFIEIGLKDHSLLSCPPLLVHFTYANRGVAIKTPSGIYDVCQQGISHNIYHTKHPRSTINVVRDLLLY